MGRSAALVLLAALAALLFTHRVWIEAPREHGFESYDTSAYFYPTAVYLHESLREGRLPLWNPYQLAGQPFLALHVPGALYPPNLLLIGLLPPAIALAALTVLHLWVAGTFSWLFAARIGLGAAACASAAVAYMLCGSLVSGIYNPTYLATMAWLPAILWAVHRLCSDVRPRACLALATTLALSFLGGHAQGFVYSLHLALPYGVFALWAVTRRSKRVRAIQWVAASGVLAAGLVAPQALPTLELQQQAVRSFDGHSLAAATASSHSPTRILRGTVGQPAPLVAENPVGPLRWTTAWPLLGLPLLLCGFAPRTLRPHWLFFVVAAIGSGLFVMGGHTPVYSLYFALPFGDLFRAPMRFTFVYSFCVGMGIAIGVEALTRWLRGFDRVGAMPAKFLPAGIVLVIVIDLYSRTGLVSTHPVLEGQPSLPRTDLIELLRHSPGRERVFIGNFKFGDGSGLTTKSGTAHRFFAVPDYEPAIPEAYRRYFSQPNPTWHGELGAKFTPHLPALVRPLDLMSVRYYLAPPGRESDEPRNAARGLERDFGAAILFDHAGSLPRAYAVQQILVEPDPARAMQLIARRRFRPSREAIVEAIDPRGPAASLVASPQRRLPARLPPNRVSITSYAPERVVLDADCAQKCLVVLTDLFYPGWRAYVGEREQPVHRVNTLYRGVVLEPGRHEVVYRFEPRPFYWGVAIAGATIVVIGAIWVRTSDRPERHAS